MANPFDQPAKDKGMYQMQSPAVPAYDGKQFAADSMTPEELSVPRDQYFDERPVDDPTAKNCTPQHSNPTYTGRQYSDDNMGGYNSYGVSVNAAPKAKTMDVNGATANRGKDS